MNPVLIIEDDKDLQTIYELRFAEVGIPIVIRGSGLEALAEVHTIKPSLILLDVYMPDMDGIQFMKSLSMQGVMKYPTIVCSNLSSEGTIADCKALGCLEYIVKSRTDIREIVKKVQRIVTQK